MARPMYEICMDIRRDWKNKDGKPNVNYAAKPYLEAMECLTDINSPYGMDSGKSVVLYFLANAQSWHGPLAKAVKAELKAMAGVK